MKAGTRFFPYLARSRSRRSCMRSSMDCRSEAGSDECVGRSILVTAWSDCERRTDGLNMPIATSTSILAATCNRLRQFNSFTITLQMSDIAAAVGTRAYGTRDELHLILLCDHDRGRRL